MKFQLAAGILLLAVLAALALVFEGDSTPAAPTSTQTPQPAPDEKGFSNLKIN